MTSAHFLKELVDKKTAYFHLINMQLFGILQERPLNWIIACYVQSLKRGPNLVIKCNVMHRELELHITQIVALFRFEGNIPVRDFLTASENNWRQEVKGFDGVSKLFRR